MPQLSAGLLMVRHEQPAPEFFLVHPGGPFYTKKDDGAWSIPKGLCDDNEDFLAAAIREFEEETGISPHGNFQPLGSVKLKSGKIVHAWMFFGAWDERDGITSNTFPLEWPPRSGQIVQFPEADKAQWFDFDTAMRKINANQQPLVQRAREFCSDQ